MSANLVLLGRFLRQKGYTIGLKEETELLKVLQLIPISDRQNIKAAFKAIITKSDFQYSSFDDDFDEFWNQLAKAVDSKIKNQPEQKQTKSPQKSPPSVEVLKNWLYNMEANEEHSIAAFSSVESLTRKDFAEMDSDELRLITQLLKKITRQLKHQKSRLRVRSKYRKKIDLKNTVRSGMRFGGDWPFLKFTEPKEKKLKLLLICDVSRSMELYSRFFIHLIYAFQNAYDRVNTWVFSTAVHDVSSLLKNYEFDKAFELIADRVPQWSGGTKIGECLSLFMEKRESWSLDKKTVVFIVSDGWDTGDPEKLSESMSAIHKKVKKVIWLNPLAGNPDFAPEVLGLQSALPFIDVHTSCHNLESLKQAFYYVKTSKKATPF